MGSQGQLTNARATRKLVSYVSAYLHLDQLSCVENSNNLALPNWAPFIQRSFLSAFTNLPDALGISIIGILEQIMAQKATIYKVELSDVSTRETDLRIS
jgi:hypothetical protein